MPIETFKYVVESTQNMQQHGAKITCTEVTEKNYGEWKYDNFGDVLWF